MVQRALLVALKLTALTSLCCMPLLACSASDGDADDPEFEQEPGSEEQALTSSVSCTHESQPAYSGGSRIGTVDTIKIGGKRTTVKTGNAFLSLQKKAASRGITVSINSGFRTMDEQRYFYGCYQSGRCNNGNLAARPGYSNHQSGRALDLGTNNRSGLNRLISDLHLDWRRTVPSEAWHYEYFGPLVSGPCDGSSAGDDDDDDSPAPSSGGETPSASGGSCHADGDCNPGNDGSGKICSNGTCVPGCHANAQCPGATLCHSGECR
jgi:hypothetical protein